MSETEEYAQYVQAVADALLFMHPVYEMRYPGDNTQELLAQTRIVETSDTAPQFRIGDALKLTTSYVQFNKWVASALELHESKLFNALLIEASEQRSDVRREDITNDQCMKPELIGFSDFATNAYFGERISEMVSLGKACSRAPMNVDFDLSTAISGGLKLGLVGILGLCLAQKLAETDIDLVRDASDCAAVNMGYHAAVLDGMGRNGAYTLFPNGKLDQQEICKYRIRGTVGCPMTRDPSKKAMRAVNEILGARDLPELERVPMMHRMVPFVARTYDRILAVYPQKVERFCAQARKGISNTTDL
ncbi:MAG: hypothetical protein OXR66_01905 [Candidatus Woesearchaeota archaeon]|nr:hypothetical protein [Candidatus Woesearchaeota archaeon]